MKEEFEKAQNLEETVVEENKIEGTENNKKKSKKNRFIAVGVFIIALILLLTLTSYKLLLTPSKMVFLGQVTKDVVTLNSFIENIEDSKILNFITNKESKNSNFDFTINAKKISGEVITDKEYLALKLNDITEKYWLLENKNLDDLFNKFGFEVSGLPSKINFDNNPILFSNSEKRKIYSFITNYVSEILNNLEKENITSNEKVIFDVNGEDLTLKSVEVQLSEKDMFMVQKEALIYLQKEGILNMFINKINKISTAETIDKKAIKAEIEKYIAYLDYAKAYYDLQDAENEYYIVYKMYYNENGVVAREIIEKYSYEGKLYEDIICSLITNPNGYYEVKWFNQEGYSSAYYNIVSDKITTTDNKQNHEIKYAIEGFYVGTAEDTEDYQYVPMNGETVYNVVIETLDDGETKVELVDLNNLYDFALNYTDSSANLEFATVYNEVDIEAKLQIKDSEITKKELLDNGAISVNDKSQEELMAEFSKIGAKFSEIFAE